MNKLNKAINIALNYIDADISHHLDCNDEDAAIECLDTYNEIAKLAGKELRSLKDYE